MGDDNWPGNRVMFDTKGYNQGNQWRINTLILNPMTELLGRAPYRDGNGIHFNWLILNGHKQTIVLNPREQLLRLFLEMILSMMIFLRISGWQRIPYHDQKK